MKKSFTQLLPKLIASKLEGRENLSKILSNIGWLSLDKIVRMGVGMVVGVWMARYLGPENFGILNYVIAFTGIFGIIATGGLDSILVREIIKDPQDRDVLMGSALGLKIIGALLAIILIAIAIFLLKPGNLSLQIFALIIGGSYLFQSLDIIDFYFQSQVASKHVVYARNISFIILSAIKVIFIINKFPLIAFVWTFLGEAILSAALLSVNYNRIGLKISNWKYNALVAKKILKDSLPLALSSIVVMIYMRIDQIMLGDMIDNNAVGNYSAAVKLSEIWFIIPMIITTSIFPSIISARKNDTDLYYGRLQQLYNIMVWISLSIAIIMFFLSNPITTFLYGAKYQEAGNILAIHIWTGIFVFLGVASSQFLMSENLTYISLYRTALGALVNIVLNLFMIPKYGPIGAAYATLISYCVATFSLVFFKSSRSQCFMMLNAFNPFLLVLFIKKNFYAK